MPDLKENLTTPCPNCRNVELSIIFADLADDNRQSVVKHCPRCGLALVSYNWGAHGGYHVYERRPILAHEREANAILALGADE